LHGVAQSTDDGLPVADLGVARDATEPIWIGRRLHSVNQDTRLGAMPLQSNPP